MDEISKELRIKNRYFEIIDQYSQNIGKELYKILVDDYLIGIVKRKTQNGNRMTLCIRDINIKNSPIPLFTLDTKKINHYKCDSYVSYICNQINELESVRQPISLLTEGEILTLDYKYEIVTIVKSVLPKSGKGICYRFAEYLYEGNFIEHSIPIGNFKINNLMADVHFNTPISGKFNIGHPFSDVIFQSAVVKANGLGEILFQISDAFKIAYEIAHEQGIECILSIDEIVFDDTIYIYENGTIVFDVDLKLPYSIRMMF